MEAAGVYHPDDASLTRAKDNITRLRQRDVTLRLTDRQGNPLAGLPVEVLHRQHDFPFGDNLWSLDTMHRDGQWDTPRADAWRRRFAEVFNTANALCYWTERPRNHGPKTEDQQGFPQYEHFARCVEWALGEKLQVKGHPLFWSIPKCVPEWVKRYDYETQMKFVEVRVRSMVARFKGRVSLWDAINEALWEPAFKNLPERDWPHIEPTDALVEYISPVLRWAREEDPTTTLTLNDYGLEPGRKELFSKQTGQRVDDQLQRQRMVELANALRAVGTPPDALGLQAHTSGFLNGAQWHGIWDELAEAGLPLHITEFWVPRDIAVEDEQEREAMKAAYARDVLTLAFGHPAIEAFFFWGFMGQAIQWGAKGTTSSGHELLPMFDAVHDLIHETWQTRAKLVTDDEGVVRFRGFTGAYELMYQPTGSDTAPMMGMDFAIPRANRGQHALHIAITR